MTCVVCNKDWCWHCQECHKKVSSLKCRLCNSCEAKTMPGHYACKECGLYYHTSLTGEELREGLCFSCNFWQEKVEFSHQKDTTIIRANGNCYYLDKIAVVDRTYGYKSSMGFGGAQCNIITDDNRVFSTCNMWNNGEIPEHFKDRLPNNARLVSDKEATEFAIAVSQGLVLLI